MIFLNWNGARLYKLKLDASSIFENKTHVKDLLKLIGNYDSDNIDTNCFYGQLSYNYGKDFIQTNLTHLWFLPVTDLYNADQKDPNCQLKSFPKQKIKNWKRDIDEGDRQPDEDSEKSEKAGRPHIEPLFRGLALLLMENKFYKKHFNILIVHNDGKLFKISNLKNKHISCVCDIDENSKISV